MIFDKTNVMTFDLFAALHPQKQMTNVSNVPISGRKIFSDLCGLYFSNINNCFTFQIKSFGKKLVKYTGHSKNQQQQNKSFKYFETLVKKSRYFKLEQ